MMRLWMIPAPGTGDCIEKSNVAFFTQNLLTASKDYVMMKLIAAQSACCSSWGHKESDMTERLN